MNFFKGWKSTSLPDETFNLDPTIHSLTSMTNEKCEMIYGKWALPTQPVVTDLTDNAELRSLNFFLLRLSFLNLRAGVGATI